MSRGTRKGPHQALACGSLAHGPLQRGSRALGPRLQDTQIPLHPSSRSSRAVTRGAHQASCCLGHGLHVNKFSPDRRPGGPPAQTAAPTPGLVTQDGQVGDAAAPVPCSHRRPVRQHLSTPASPVPAPGLSPPASPSSTHQKEETDSQGPPLVLSVTRDAGTRPGCPGASWAPHPILTAECPALGRESSQRNWASRHALSLHSPRGSRKTRSTEGPMWSAPSKPMSQMDMRW